MGVVFWEDAGGRVTAEAIFRQGQQGPPGHAHGGMIAAVLDEAMGAAVWRAGYRAVALRVEIDYLRPVPLHVPVRVDAHVGDVTGRAVRALGRLTLPGGAVAATGFGIFVESPQLFDAAFYRAVEKEEPPGARASSGATSSGPSPQGPGQDGSAGPDSGPRQSGL
jgi:acyl-coenzyme A thioesterase PaaI-like protein